MAQELKISHSAPALPESRTQDPHSHQKDSSIHRLNALEKARLRLHWTQRWPTPSSIQKHQWSKSTPCIEISRPPHACGCGAWHYTWNLPVQSSRPEEASLRQLLRPAIYPRVHFPYPVLRATDGGGNGTNSQVRLGFQRFGELPAEIRIQIWEIELRRPKFIEVQFDPGISGAGFVGASTRPWSSVLLGVCRESRDVAIAFATLEKEGEKVAFLVLNRRRSTYHPATSVDPDIAPKVPFVPERDTIFFRPLGRSPNDGLQCLRNRIAVSKIQHLALLLPPNGLPMRGQWSECFHDFEDLKTLTFMLGGWDQSWMGEGGIELRDLEEWYVDGRTREYKVRKWIFDVDELTRFLTGQYFVTMVRDRGWANEKKKRRNWEGVNVRVVAWRKGV